MNPCPEQVGGVPTRTSKAYGLIRAAVGTGGSAKNDLGLEGLWRRSKAHGLAAATSSIERAVVQLDPHLATDFLPYYERVLGLVPGPNDPQATRAENAASLWTRTIDASIPNVAAELAKIDARLSVLSFSHDLSATVHEGRAFGAHDPADEPPVFSGVGYAILPNYSTDFVVHVRFATGHTGPYTAAELLIVERVKTLTIRPTYSW